MYLQIVDQIKQRVAVGDWIPGQEIPSIRGLAADLRVSVITVKREGIIVTCQGKGSFIADGSPELGTWVRQEELLRHLTATIEISKLLGWGPREINDALSEIQKRHK
jgi:GntR family transcriptional regulator